MICRVTLATLVAILVAATAYVVAELYRAWSEPPTIREWGPVPFTAPPQPYPRPPMPPSDDIRPR